jgi:hypothetical protein
MMVEGNDLSDPQGGFYDILTNEQYGPRLNLCPRERFYYEISPGVCSGFLIGPQRLATAGHCVPDENYCKNWFWVFGYAISNEKDGPPMRLSPDQVYSCAKIVKTVQDDKGNDFAIIDLDRPVKGRKPLKLNLSDKVDAKAELVLIGNPEGMPTKIAAGGRIMSSDDISITAAINSYTGNSGSAVFNAKTWQVEGILIAGETDYVDDTRYNCRVSKICKKDDDCQGESIVKSSVIKEFVPRKIEAERDKKNSAAASSAI